MSLLDNDALARFGISEIYIHGNFTHNLREKLYQRAVLTLDGDDNIAQKHASHDMILIFHKQEPTPSLIYRFLKFLHESKDREYFIESNTLLNEEELYSAIKSKEFVLVTHRILAKETYRPS